MPIIKRSTSALGQEIVSSIKSFIDTNASGVEGDGDQMTVEKAAEIEANTIAYGIAKALSSTSLKTVLSTSGVVPPSGSSTFGQVLANAISGIATEV